MSLLPQQILPPGQPIGNVRPDGSVQIDKNWWLLLYNLCQSVLGTSTVGLPASALTELAAADSDAADTDAVSLVLPIANEQVQHSDPMVSDADIPSVYRSIMLALDPLVPDARPLAQPSAAITPTGSPFTYTVPFSGAVTVTGGVVSVISIKRQGATVATGVTVGVFPVSQNDQLVVTYTGAPTMVFLPT